MEWECNCPKCRGCGPEDGHNEDCSCDDCHDEHIPHKDRIICQRCNDEVEWDIEKGVRCAEHGRYSEECPECLDEERGGWYE